MASKADGISGAAALSEIDFRSTWRFKACAIATLAVIDVIWISLTDFRFDYASAATPAAVCVVLAVVAWIYRVKRPMPQFEALCVETVFLILIAAVGVPFSYLATSVDLPLIDGELLRLDTALGFDWMAYVAFVNERPWLGKLSSAVYATTMAQVAVAIVVLGLCGHGARASRFVTAVVISTILCVLISMLLPAAGALATIRPPEEFVYANFPTVDLTYKQAFFDLRSGAERFISLDAPKGLIAFPSYHCALSLLVVLAFASLRGWFAPVAALNIAVILSTPIDGGHHMADALGGMALALACWWIAGASIFGGGKTARAVRPLGVLPA